MPNDRYRLTLVIPNLRWLPNDPNVFWHIVPYNVCLLAAIVEDLCDVTIIDAYKENLDGDRFAAAVAASRPDAVGITVLMDQFGPAGHHAAKLVKAARPQAVVLMGGVYPTINPDKVMQDGNVDYAVIGEGDRVLRDLVAHLRGKGPRPAKGIAFREGGQVVDTGHADFVEDLDALPLPAYHLVEFSRYATSVDRKSVDSPRQMPYARILTSRGCAMNCTFCQVRKISGGFRPRSADNVLKEIAWLKETYGIRSLVFDDDSMLTDRPRAVALFEGMIARGLAMPWVMIATAEFCLDEDLIRLMRASGCAYVDLAIESGSKRILQQIIHKPVNYDHAKRMARAAQVEGIFVAANFMIGFPTETWDEIRQTLRMAEEMEVDYAKIFTVVPLRWTRLWEMAEKLGALKEETGSQQSPWNTGQTQSKEYTFKDLTILRAYEWDRINFSTAAKREKTAGMLGVTQEELQQMRRSTLLNCQASLAQIG